MKFSVLMSVYDKENPKYLDAALNSVFNQTMRADEVILIKDGILNEKLETVIKKYQTRYLELITYRFRKNRGLGYALRDGVTLCNYDIIVRMDTDDIALPNRFEKQINFMKNHPEIDVVGSNIVEYDEDLKEQIDYKIVPETNEQLQKYLKKRNPFNHMTVAFKKEAVVASGNYQCMPGFEDYYLWCRMNKNGYKFYNIQECLMTVRAGEPMIQRRGGLSYIKKIIKFEKQILKLKITNLFQFIINIIIRCFFSIVPLKMRSYFYHYLRESYEG